MNRPIDLANHKNKTHVPSNAKKLLNNLESCNLTQITSISSTSKILIDHAYVNNKNEIIHTAVPIYRISDHYPIYVLPESTKKTRRERTTDFCFRET